MKTYDYLTHVLRVLFNADHGLSERQAISLYLEEASQNREKIEQELLQAFADGQLSWMKMLRNESYEVLDADSEEEARSYAKRILWDPIMKDRKPD